MPGGSGHPRTLQNAGAPRRAQWLATWHESIPPPERSRLRPLSWISFRAGHPAPRRACAGSRGLPHGPGRPTPTRHAHHRPAPRERDDAERKPMRTIVRPRVIRIAECEGLPHRNEQPLARRPWVIAILAFASAKPWRAVRASDNSSNAPPSDGDPPQPIRRCGNIPRKSCDLSRFPPSLLASMWMKFF